MPNRPISSDDPQSGDLRVHENPPGLAATPARSPGAGGVEAVCGKERDGDGPERPLERTSGMEALDDNNYRLITEDADAPVSATGEAPLLAGSAPAASRRARAPNMLRLP